MLDGQKKAVTCIILLILNLLRLLVCQHINCNVKEKVLSVFQYFYFVLTLCSIYFILLYSSCFVHLYIEMHKQQDISCRLCEIFGIFIYFYIAVLSLNYNFKKIIFLVLYFSTHPELVQSMKNSSLEKAGQYVI